MYLVNSRPVSVFPVFSKVFERLVYGRTTEFVKENDIIYNMQFDFGKGHSTSIARMLSSDWISKALHDGEYILCIFIDFSKAFDTMNDEIVLQKLYCYGIKAIFHDWVKGYSQYVLYEEV